MSAKLELLVALLGLALVAVSCGGGSSSEPLVVPAVPRAISVSLSSSTVTAGPNGTPGSVTVTVNRPSGNTSSVTLTASSVPAGVNTQITSPGSGDSGTVAFTPQAQGGPAAGSYRVTVNASYGTSIASANLTLVIVTAAATTCNITTTGTVQADNSVSGSPRLGDVYQVQGTIVANYVNDDSVAPATITVCPGNSACSPRAANSVTSGPSW